MDEEQVVSTTFIGENLWASWSDEEKAAKKQELFDKSTTLSPYTDKTDQFRHETASPYGGFCLTDPDRISLLRSSVGEIIGVSLLISHCKHSLLFAVIVCLNG